MLMTNITIRNKQHFYRPNSHSKHNNKTFVVKIVCGELTPQLFQPCLLLHWIRQNAKCTPCCHKMHKLVTSTWCPWNCCSQSSISNMSTISLEVYSPMERSVKWRMYDACCATIATVSTKYKVRLHPWRKGLKYTMEFISIYVNTIILYTHQ